MLKDILNQGKDLLIGSAVIPFVNGILKPIGKMSSLKIDSSAKLLHMTLELDGEASPVQLAVQYSIISPTLLTVRVASSSRPWISTLVNEMIPEQSRQIPVPEMVTKALS